MSLVFLIAVFMVSPHFSQAKTFFASKPHSTDVINAILSASSKTSVRPAVLYGLFGQETAYGGNLGKTENSWSGFCSSRNTEDCFNWRNYDCKTDYRNASHFDEILKSLGFVTSSGNADRSSIPVSSTCAMGFTQFEPNTWWELGQSRRMGSLAPSPWDVNDSILMAAYYLEDLGARKHEILKTGDVIGEKDRIALQRYYCGGNYNRRECRVYASGVEAKAKHASVALLQAGLGDQLKVLEERRAEIKQSIEKTFIKTSQQYVPPITCNGNIHSIPVGEGGQMVLLIFKERNRSEMEKLQSEGLVAKVQETKFEFSEIVQDYQFSSEATYYGGEVVGTSYTTEYALDRVQWIAFVHRADEDVVKARIGNDLKIVPSWINRGPGSAVVEFRCGENLLPRIPESVTTPIVPNTRLPDILPLPIENKPQEPVWPPGARIPGGGPHNI